MSRIEDTLARMIMTSRRMALFLIFGMMSLTSCAVPQKTLWEIYIDAGRSASQQGRHAEAEKLYLAALNKAEGFGPLDPRLAASLDNLAELYRVQGKYAEAINPYRQAVLIWEMAVGPLCEIGVREQFSIG